MGKLWNRVWEEIKYQWHPFSESHVRYYDIEDEPDIPGFWSKGKFLKEPKFWLVLGGLALFFWLIT